MEKLRGQNANLKDWQIGKMKLKALESLKPLMKGISDPLPAT